MTAYQASIWGLGVLTVSIWGTEENAPGSGAPARPEQRRCFWDWGCPHWAPAWASPPGLLERRLTCVSGPVKPYVDRQMQEVGIATLRALAHSLGLAQVFLSNLSTLLNLGQTTERPPHL